MRLFAFSLAVFFCLTLAVSLAAPRKAKAAPSGTWTVVNTLDSGNGSLRWAIDQANNNAGPDTIDFSTLLIGSTINPTSELPTITADDTTMDASSIWDGTWPAGKPGITLDGASLMMTGTVGLRVSGAHNFAVKGMTIQLFGTGIRIANGASGAVIGSGSSGGRMLIRRIAGNAIEIDSSDDNRVIGSYIGTSIAGNLREPNDGSGISIMNGKRNQVGGYGALEGNLIGSNGADGVYIYGSGAISNVVVANSIGIGTLNSPITNTLDGVYIGNGATFNGVGGIVYVGSWGGYVYSSTVGNTIYGSGQDGVRLENPATAHNGVMLSTIDYSGRYGIHVDGANDNAAGENTVTRNGQTGIMLDNGATDNWIVSNWVGTDKWGTSGLGNGHHSIAMYGGAQRNVIQSNYAVASGWSGIAMVNPTTQFNWLVWNKIGLGPQGQAKGNSYYGVAAVESPYNALTANEIGYNGMNQEAGVFFDAATAVGNSAFQNSIHDNAGPGIQLTNGANHNLPAPTITSAVCPAIHGTGAPPYGIVQVFSDQAEEGAVYEARTIADGAGNWSLSSNWKGPHLTATASQTVTVPSSAPMRLHSFALKTPSGMHTTADLARPLATARWDTSAFSAYIASGACWTLYLPLIVK